MAALVARVLRAAHGLSPIGPASVRGVGSLEESLSRWLGLGWGQGPQLCPEGALRGESPFPSPPAQGESDALQDDGVVLAVPKKRVTRSRKRIRNAGKFPKPRTNLTPCPACGNIKMHHHLCRHCTRMVQLHSKPIRQQREAQWGNYTEEQVQVQLKHLGPDGVRETKEAIRSEVVEVGARGALASVSGRLFGEDKEKARAEALQKKRSGAPGPEARS